MCLKEVKSGEEIFKSAVRCFLCKAKVRYFERLGICVDVGSLGCVGVCKTVAVCN